MLNISKNKTESDVEFYTIYDSKAKCYTEPFPAKNREVILRDFLNAFKNPEAGKTNRYFQNAEDFSIFKIGQFDLKSGELTGTTMEHVVNLHDLRSISSPAALISTW